MPPETFQHAPTEAEKPMCWRSGLIIPNIVDTERKKREKKRGIFWCIHREDILDDTWPVLCILVRGFGTVWTYMMWYVIRSGGASTGIVDRMTSVSRCHDNIEFPCQRHHRHRCLLPPTACPSDKTALSSLYICPPACLVESPQ